MGSNTWITITLPIAYSNTDYGVCAGFETNSSSATGSWSAVSYTSRTVTSFTAGQERYSYGYTKIILGY